MAELIIVKVHSDNCTAAAPSAAMLAFAEKYPNYCAACNATGFVNRSGMVLPCGRCMNGSPYNCPRCGHIPEARVFWTPGVDCVFCNWHTSADGAPVQDCDCPERVEQKETDAFKKEFKNKDEAHKSKRERLEALAGVRSAGKSQDDVRPV